MERCEKQVVFDRKLQMEGYLFHGLAQPFPTHFHSHYVLGLVERGTRKLSCKGRELTLRPGSLMLLNPGDSHACVQCGGTLDYRSVNIPIEAMLELSKVLTGKETLPIFPEPTADDGVLSQQFRLFHRRLMAGDSFAAEEALLLFLSNLPESDIPPTPQEFRQAEAQEARAFIERHFSERISLDMLCHCTGLSKSTLLRSFTREAGITPYRYLETVRVNRAKELLDKGAAPLDAALQTGFSDQSHFTNCFTRHIGLPPGMYQTIRNERGIHHGHSK